MYLNVVFKTKILKSNRFLLINQNLWKTIIIIIIIVVVVVVDTLF